MSDDQVEEVVRFMSKEQILASADFNYEEIEAFGGIVRIREMSAEEREGFEKEFSKAGAGTGSVDLSKVGKNMRARLVVSCVVDAAGQNIFADQDVEKLAKKSASDVDKIFSACMKLSGITGDEVVAAAGE